LRQITESCSERVNLCWILGGQFPAGAFQHG
jgi:hypothetical protein